MVGVAIYPISGTADLSRIEAPVTFKAYLLCGFAAFGGIFFGYDTGWMSGTLGMPYFISLYTGLQYDYDTGTPIGVSAAAFALPSATKSLMTSILSCGTFFGALIAGDIADFYGRRPTIITGCVIFCLGCILEIASTNQEVLFVIGRLVAGGGVGFISAIIILYMSEVAPRRFRGALVSGYQFCITLGILFANCVVYATANRNDTGSYRIPIGVQFLWAVILGIGLYLLPESPRYHVQKGMLECAAEDLARVRGQPVESEFIKDELAEIVANHEYEMQVIPQTSYIGSWMACFQGGLSKGNGNLRRTILGTGLQMMQQFTGINFIFYFGTTFFQQLGTISNPFFISLVTTLVNVVSTPLSFWTIEKFGRRLLLIGGAIGMIGAQFIVAIVGVTAGRVEANNAGAVKSMIAFICINIFFFATTWGPVAWVIVGEAFPLPIRSRGVGLSTASNWFWNCIIAVITPYMVGNSPGSADLGPRVFFIWGSLCMLSLAFAYFLVPEMKGLTLEQIDKMMEQTSPRTSAATMTSMSAESVSTILVSCKQTRFHIESPNYRELDIEGLNITVTSAAPAPPSEGASTSTTTSTKSAKAKAKASKGAEGTEILSNAKLRLRPGSRYALVGRNGSGKSTLLRAIAEKLIPGIHEKTRVTILQQTNADDAANSDDDAGTETAAAAVAAPSVLESVIDKATAKSELEQEIAILFVGIDSDEPYGALRALRQLRHTRMLKHLFVLDKDARLRSGARGLQARKALVEHEKAVAQSAALNEQADADISADTLQTETQEAADELADLQLQVEPARMSDLEARAKKMLAGLGFSDAYMARPAASLSGGWAMRSALAAALLQGTDILILDEPTNFLDLLGILWLQRHLTSLSSDGDDHDPDGGTAPTLILVSHDRDFISLCTDLLILKDKALSYFHGDLALYEATQAERRTHLAKVSAAQDKQKAHMQETIRQNMAAGRRADDTAKVRQAKSRQKKLDERWGVQTSAKGTRFKLNRDLAGFHLSKRDALDVPADDSRRATAVALPPPTELRFPGPLLSLEGVSFRYPGQKADALHAVTLSAALGDRIAILGLNGAGKSTLVRLLVGDSGSTSTRQGLTRHPRLRLGYYSQHAVSLLQNLGRAEPSLTALSLLLRETSSSSSGDEAAALDEGDVRGLLASLGLAGRVASDVPLRKLSGGQLVRCELARLLWRRPHLLVLDEVTTHLDYETVAALRGALRAWPGAVVLVSHDRWFVRGVVEGDSDGSDDGEGAGADAARRRLVYKIHAGKLVLLPGGVQEFEASIEKRVRKLMG
ncbi:putative transporter protein [Lasiosphaeria miniovina]|uniref:Transporter protein n=1 Tax=Lasiosphaeria miniovina TaxID=1954250 RepID=A0AA40DJ18_9PEZI|nr:putative transporter protein [Lasiosphaeria miniovina]KAK0701733.1 putative transporter protein [Lasiosphaeria miniovina]